MQDGVLLLILCFLIGTILLDLLYRKGFLHAPDPELHGGRRRRQWETPVDPSQWPEMWQGGQQAPPPVIQPERMGRSASSPPPPVQKPQQNGQGNQQGGKKQKRAAQQPQPQQQQPPQNPRPGKQRRRFQA